MGVGANHHLFGLVTRHTLRFEGYGYIAGGPRSDALTWVIGHRAATRGVTAADDEVGVAGVGELEAIGDILTSHELAEVVHVGLESDSRHTLVIVVSLRAVRVVDYVDVAFAVSSATGGEKQCRCQKDRFD